MMKDVFFFQTQNDKILILPERPQHAIAFLLQLIINKIKALIHKF
jgi:hypothetical protein